MQIFTAYTNVFDDGEGRRYPGGILFETASAAIEAQDKKTVGTAVYAARHPDRGAEVSRGRIRSCRRQG